MSVTVVGANESPFPNERRELLAAILTLKNFSVIHYLINHEVILIHVTKVSSQETLVP